jgi:hypothetical protein
MGTGIAVMQKLTLAELANIAEVVGAVAVVLSLLYVGYQVKQNTSEVRATNRQQLVGRAHTATQNMAGNPQLADVLTRAFNGSELTDSEATQFSYIVRGVLYDVQEAYLLYREGRLDQEYWDTRAALFSVYLRQDTARALYRRDRDLGLLHADFARWADSVTEGETAID